MNAGQIKALHHSFRETVTFARIHHLTGPGDASAFLEHATINNEPGLFVGQLLSLVRMAYQAPGNIPFADWLEEVREASVDSEDRALEIAQFEAMLPTDKNEEEQ